VIRGSF